MIQYDRQSTLDFVAPGWGAGVVEEELYGVAADGGEGVGQPPVAAVDAFGEVVGAEESDVAALQGVGIELAAHRPAQEHHRVHRHGGEAAAQAVVDGDGTVHLADDAGLLQNFFDHHL